MIGKHLRKIELLQIFNNIKIYMSESYQEDINSRFISDVQEVSENQAELAGQKDNLRTFKISIIRSIGSNHINFYSFISKIYATYIKYIRIGVQPNNQQIESLQGNSIIVTSRRIQGTELNGLPVTSDEEALFIEINDTNNITTIKSNLQNNIVRNALGTGIGLFLITEYVQNIIYKYKEIHTIFINNKIPVVIPWGTAKSSILYKKYAIENENLYDDNPDSYIINVGPCLLDEVSSMYNIVKCLYLEKYGNNLVEPNRLPHQYNTLDGWNTNSNAAFNNNTNNQNKIPNIYYYNTKEQNSSVYDMQYFVDMYDKNIIFVCTYSVHNNIDYYIRIKNYTDTGTNYVAFSYTKGIDEYALNTPIKNLELQKGKTYRFIINNTTDKEYNIGNFRGQNITGIIIESTGTGNTSINGVNSIKNEGEYLSFTIPIDYSGPSLKCFTTNGGEESEFGLTYYCDQDYVEYLKYFKNIASSLKIYNIPNYNNIRDPSYNIYNYLNNHIREDTENTNYTSFKNDISYQSYINNLYSNPSSNQILCDRNNTENINSTNILNIWGPKVSIISIPDYQDLSNISNKYTTIYQGWDLIRKIFDSDPSYNLNNTHIFLKQENEENDLRTLTKLTDPSFNEFIPITIGGLYSFKEINFSKVTNNLNDLSGLKSIKPYNAETNVVRNIFQNMYNENPENDDPQEIDRDINYDKSLYQLGVINSQVISLILLNFQRIDENGTLRTRTGSLFYRNVPRGENLYKTMAFFNFFNIIRTSGGRQIQVPDPNTSLIFNGVIQTAAIRSGSSGAENYLQFWNQSNGAPFNRNTSYLLYDFNPTDIQNPSLRSDRWKCHFNQYVTSTAPGSGAPVSITSEIDLVNAIIFDMGGNSTEYSRYYKKEVDKYKDILQSDYFMNIFNSSFKYHYETDKFYYIIFKKNFTTIDLDYTLRPKSFSIIDTINFAVNGWPINTDSNNPEYFTPTYYDISDVLFDTSYTNLPPYEGVDDGIWRPVGQRLEDNILFQRKDDYKWDSLGYIESSDFINTLNTKILDISNTKYPSVISYLSTFDNNNSTTYVNFFNTYAKPKIDGNTNISYTGNNTPLQDFNDLSNIWSSIFNVNDSSGWNVFDWSNNGININNLNTSSIGEIKKDALNNPQISLSNINITATAAYIKYQYYILNECLDPSSNNFINDTSINYPFLQYSYKKINSIFEDFIYNYIRKPGTPIQNVFNNRSFNNLSSYKYIYNNRPDFNDPSFTNRNDIMFYIDMVDIYYNLFIQSDYQVTIPSGFQIGAGLPASSNVASLINSNTSTIPMVFEFSYNQVLPYTPAGFIFVIWNNTPDGNEQFEYALNGSSNNFGQLYNVHSTFTMGSDDITNIQLSPGVPSNHPLLSEYSSSSFNDTSQNISYNYALVLINPSYSLGYIIYTMNGTINIPPPGQITSGLPQSSTVASLINMNTSTIPMVFEFSYNETLPYTPGGYIFTIWRNDQSANYAFEDLIINDVSYNFGEYYNVHSYVIVGAFNIGNIEIMPGINTGHPLGLANYSTNSFNDTSQNISYNYSLIFMNDSLIPDKNNVIYDMSGIINISPQGQGGGQGQSGLPHSSNLVSMINMNTSSMPMIFEFSYNQQIPTPGGYVFMIWNNDVSANQEFENALNGSPGNFNQNYFVHSEYITGAFNIGNIQLTPGISADNPLQLTAYSANSFNDTSQNISYNYSLILMNPSGELENIIYDMSGIINIQPPIKYYVRLNSNAFNSPYYLFSSEINGTALNLSTTNLDLIKGRTYIFERTDTGHAINFGDAWKSNNTGITINSSATTTSQLVNSVESIENSETLTFTIPIDYSGILKYYCYIHSSMVGSFNISSPSLRPDFSIDGLYNSINNILTIDISNIGTANGIGDNNTDYTVIISVTENSNNSNTLSTLDNNGSWAGMPAGTPLYPYNSNKTYYPVERISLEDCSLTMITSTETNMNIQLDEDFTGGWIGFIGNTPSLKVNDHIQFSLTLSSVFSPGTYAIFTDDGTLNATPSGDTINEIQETRDNCSNNIFVWTI